jgi:uncharacterized membrane protein
MVYRTVGFLIIMFGLASLAFAYSSGRNALYALGVAGLLVGVYTMRQAR